jgi:hypothetical protein
MLSRVLLGLLCAALLAAAVPLQRRSFSPLVLLDQSAQHKHGLTVAQIQEFKAAALEARDAIKIAIDVLTEPNFQNTGLFHTFLDREFLAIVFRWNSDLCCRREPGRNPEGHFREDPPCATRNH